MPRRPSGARPRRQVRRVESRRVVALLTEGEVTEPEYFRAIGSANSAVRVRVIATDMTPSQLVDRARKVLRASDKARRVSGSPDYDEIWCVMDTDAHPDLAEATQVAARSGIRTAVSNPCFELWLLLHLGEQTAVIDRRRAHAEANRKGILEGKHLSARLNRELVERYPDAKRRAEGLDAMHTRDGRAAGSNPSSHVWQLVDRLL